MLVMSKKVLQHEALEDHLEAALRDLELDAPRIKSIVAWP